MKQMLEPNFFLVGAPKCGTTSLYYYLLQHPEVFMPHVPDVASVLEEPLAHSLGYIHQANLLKEPHFFGSDLHFGQGHRAAASLDEYLALFAGATDEKAIGEASVFYLCSTRAAEEIKELAPCARIIIMLRNPVEVMFRLHGQQCLTGSEAVTDFEAALAAEPERKENLDSLMSDADLKEALLYRHCVGFAAQVERYFHCFGREHTKVVLFDDFKADSMETYRSVLQFLGVDDRFVPRHLAANPMSEIRNPRLQRFLTHPPKRLQHLARLLTPPGLRRRLVGGLIRGNVDYGKRPKLSPGLRKRLQEECSAEISALGSLLERDLTGWMS